MARNARHLFISWQWLTSSAVIGRNSKLTGVGLFPGDDTELDVGDSGNWNAVVHGYKHINKVILTLSLLTSLFLIPMSTLNKNVIKIHPPIFLIIL